MKKRIGLFIPPRPENHLDIADPLAAVGCLRPQMHASLMEELLAAADIEWVRDLNFSGGLVRDGKVWCEGVDLNDLDGFAWYCEVDRRPGSFDLALLKTLARKVRVVRDPEIFETALDKYTAHLALLDTGARVAECVLFDHRVPRKMAGILDEWGGAILKPRRGGWGKGVTYIDNADMLRDIIGYMQSTVSASPDQGYFLERFYPNDPDRWASITMIDGDVMYGYRKLQAKQVDMGGGRIKILDADEKGGGVERASLVEEHFRQAELAYRALPLGLIGFDMIWSGGKPVIVDENTSPGNYDALYREAGIDPGKRLARWLLRELQTS